MQAAEQALRQDTDPRYLAPAWVAQQQAFVDPGDPSRIFLVQPTTASSSGHTGVAADVSSASSGAPYYEPPAAEDPVAYYASTPASPATDASRHYYTPSVLGYGGSLPPSSAPAPPSADQGSLQGRRMMAGASF